MRHLTQRMIVLAVLLGILACNLPIATQTATLSTQALPTPPVSTLPPPKIDVSPTPLQSETPFTTPRLSTQTPSLVYQPVFVPADCAFPLPPDTSPDCGYLVVPENRDRPDSPAIRLHVAIFPSRSANPAPDPVVYLSGGPGSSALGLTRYMFRQGLEAILATRELIVFDQRGTGYSQPALTCPEREAITPALLEGQLSPIEKEQAIVDAFQRCHDRLTAQGIDLAAYHSKSIAADIDDLRRVLGYTQMNLYSVSYGTRLALTMMRDFPESVRSAVLDSALPLQVNLYTALAPNAERAFNVLFADCAADPSCNAAYPELKTFFYRLVDQLNASPMPVILKAGGEKQRVLLNGDLLIDVLFVGMYNPLVAASMPKMIYAIYRGETALLEERLGLYFDHSVALALQMSVICSEELPFSSPEEAFTLAQAVQSQIAGYFPGSVRPLFAACQAWHTAPPDLGENQPVTSNIPTLVLAGHLDPITPPDWGRLVASTLTQAYFYEFPANGHWVTRSSPCALSITVSFFDHPFAAPEASCIALIGKLNFAR